jgi:dihydrofolate synthase/folylpolyglutamate synthase
MRSLADWLEQQQQSHSAAIDLTLTRVREVAARMGLLKPAYRVITVGGTNGKGSTVAYLDALLRAAGRRTGRFTSPHLVRYNERICIDGVEADDGALIAAFERIEAARGSTTLTFFEYNTLAALDLFARAAVDVAVLEVGLGGRLDATNILDADVAVVCSIGLDHVEWLGSTLEQIGREKAGIFRRGKPAVLGSVGLPDSVSQALRDVGARRVAVGEDFRVTVRDTDWDYASRGLTLLNLPLPRMAGVLQVHNAATAIAALEALAADGFGIALSPAIVGQALIEAQIAGRFQRVPGPVEWVLDVAHNVPAAQALRDNLRTLPRARRQFAVCGILGDKDARGIMAVLAADVDAWILAALPGARAVSTQHLADALPAGAHLLAQAADATAGCRMAQGHAEPGDRIVVFGSFLTVGPALEFLGI